MRIAFLGLIYRKVRERTSGKTFIFADTSSRYCVFRVDRWIRSLRVRSLIWWPMMSLQSRMPLSSLITFGWVIEQTNSCNQLSRLSIPRLFFILRSRRSECVQSSMCSGVLLDTSLSLLLVSLFCCFLFNHCMAVYSSTWGSFTLLSLFGIDDLLAVEQESLRWPTNEWKSCLKSSNQCASSKCTVGNRPLSSEFPIYAGKCRIHCDRGLQSTFMHCRLEIFRYGIYMMLYSLVKVFISSYALLSFLVMYGMMWYWDLQLDTYFYAIAATMLGFMSLYTVEFFSCAIHALSRFLSARKRIQVSHRWIFSQCISRCECRFFCCSMKQNTRPQHTIRAILTSEKQQQYTATSHQHVSPRYSSDQQRCIHHLLHTIESHLHVEEHCLRSTRWWSHMHHRTCWLWKSLSSPSIDHDEWSSV
jgi:hypothetical protein